MTTTIARRRFKPLVLLVVTGIVLWFACAQHYIGNPSFSHQSGFYSEDFVLEISAFNADKIYYTLDGSVPDENSFVYAEPIKISDATCNPNNYSMRTDVSTGFMEELIKSSNGKNDPPGYKAPDFPVDKCTVIRAVAVNSKGDISKTVTASYFVKSQMENYNTKVISLVTEPDNLFDDKDGIYVTGETFEDYLEKGELGHNWSFWEANYRNHGAEWEREVNVEFFDENGELKQSCPAGIRVHGGVSRGTLPRGLNLYARREYSGFDNFGIPLFDSGYIPKRITLNSGGNQLITQFPDYMMSERTGHLNFSAMQFEPYVLFINGEYWGFYWLSEKYDGEYVEYHYDVEPGNVEMIKNGELEEGNPEDIELYNDMMSFICDNDMSLEENFQKACELVDMESLIDYYASMMYIARIEDWPGTNFALWRSRDISSKPYSDGKWRWMMFDCNSTGMREDIDLTSHNTLQRLINRKAFFNSLWQNETFREMFEQRILYIGETCFDGEDMSRFIDEYEKEMTPVLEKSWDRFYGKDNDKDKVFSDMMESHRAFFYGRIDAVKSWFQQ